jgi:RNA polymerase sigma factor (sigma-70 family)
VVLLLTPIILEGQEAALVVFSKYKEYTDSEIVALCLRGDPNAWETLIMRYKRMIYSIPVKFNFTPADAADVFQSTCVLLIEHLHELKQGERLMSWLITTTTRQCFRFRAHQARDPGAEEHGRDDDLTEPIDRKENLEDLRLRVEKEQYLRRCVEKLPEACRDLIELLYFESPVPTYEEIAEKLSIPVASIGAKRARCLERLREKFLRRRAQ